MIETTESGDRLVAELMLSTLGKIFSRRHVGVFFFLFYPENRIRHFLKIVSSGDNFHEMSNPVLWENKKTLPISPESGKGLLRTYSRLSLSRIPRYSLKYFDISVPRHIRFAELRKKIIRTTTFNKYSCNWTVEFRDILKILWKRGALFHIFFFTCC